MDINPITGIATNPRDTGIFALTGLATQPSSGQLFGLTSFVSDPANSLVKIDPTSGNYEVVGNTNLPTIVEGDLAFNPIDGMLYGLADLGTTITHRNFFRINPQTAVATVISDLPLPSDYSALAFDPLGNLFCIDSGPSDNSRLLRIDPFTGQIASTSTLNLHLGTAVGMTFDPFTGQGFVVDGGVGAALQLFGLDVALAQLTPLGATGIPEGFSGLTLIPVPEPGNFVLVFMMSLAPITKSVQRRISAMSKNC